MRPLFTLPILLAALAGLVLSTLGSLSQDCITGGCAPWRFELWWGFWVSLAAVAVLLPVLHVVTIRGRWGAVVAALALASLALAPIPYDLWAPHDLRDAVQKLTE